MLTDSTTSPPIKGNLIDLLVRFRQIFSFALVGQNGEREDDSVERHGARTPRNLFARIAVRLLALAACISLNHQLGRPSRAIADYTA